jgi:hypothetical protein
VTTPPRRTRIPLKSEWTGDLLNVASTEFEGTLGDRLNAAKKELAAAMEEIQRSLDSRPVAALVASEATRQAGRRGSSSLTIDADGLWVEITTHRKGPPTKGWSSDLPDIQELRRQAEEAGLDHAPFGRSKRKLMEALAGMHKSAPALASRTVTLEEAAEVFGGPED